MFKFVPHRYRFSGNSKGVLYAFRMWLVRRNGWGAVHAFRWWWVLRGLVRFKTEEKVPPALRTVTDFHMSGCFILVSELKHRTQFEAIAEPHVTTPITAPRTVVPYEDVNTVVLAW